MKKIFSILMAASLFSGVVSYAKVADLGNLRAEISENTGYANTLMNIEVFAPDMAYSDLENADEYTDVLVFQKVVTTDENGDILLNFKVGGENPKSGIYTVEVTGADYFNKTEVLLTDTKVAEEIISGINETISQGNETQSIETIADYLENNYYDLYVEAGDYITDAVAKKAAELVYDYLESENITLSTSNASYIMNKAVAIAALEESQVSNIIEDAKLFGMDKGELADWYEKYYVTDKTGERMAERLEGKSFDTFSEFDDALTESFILSVIEEPDGVDNVRELMKAFSDEIGTGSSGTEKQYSSVMNEVFEDFNDLADAFDSYKSDKGSSNGGGGSSSGGSKGNSGVSMPAVTVTNPAGNTNSQDGYPLPIFNDLGAVAWAEESIIALAEKGILNGKGDHLFFPLDNITREEFAAVLVRALIPNQQPAEINFADAKADAWYYESLQKAVSAGIVQGQSAEWFGVGQNITRQDMAVMINRAGAYISSDFSQALGEYEKFEDDSNIAEYAKEAVYRLKTLEIINGVDGENFAPKSYATRAEAAKMMYGVLVLQGGV